MYMCNDLVEEFAKRGKSLLALNKNTIQAMLKKGRQRVVSFKYYLA